MSKFWEGRAFCLITGASRGIGQGIAVEFGRRMEKDSALLLLSRDVKGLEETKAMVAKAAPHVKVVTESVDLGNCDSQKFLQSINSCLNKLGKKASDFQHAILIHNAASQGPLKNVADMDQAKEMQDYFNMNVFSAVCLTSQFTKVFNEAVVGKHTVVQVTSHASIVAFQTLSLYCAGKATRDMIFKTFALENPKFNVLSYAPGFVSTKLMWDYMSDLEVGQERKDVLNKNPYLLTPTATAQRLIKILEEGKYKSGDHVDAYDDPETAYKAVLPSELEF